MKIPTSNIVDLNLDLKCLTVPCPTLTNVLQEIIDLLCNSDLPSLDFGCLSPAQTTVEFYQLVINELCRLGQPVVVPAYSFELCKLDTWQCGSPTCITVTAPNNTTNDIIQALIARVNRLSTVISTQCDKIEQLEATLTNLATQVDNIKDCC